MTDLELEQVRFGYGRDTTGGFLGTITPRERICWILEDERRKEKKFGETCIPTGRREIVLYTEGEMHKRYAEKFGARHKGMLLIKDVPGFTGTMYHIGNWAYEGDEAPGGITKDDTKGCPLTGEGLILTNAVEFELASSTPAYWKLYDLVVPHLLAGGRAFVTVSER